MTHVAVRFVLLRAALAACLLASAGAGAADALRPWTGGPPPSLTGRTLRGEALALADFRGRVVLVNFWATWCAPCVAEMPALQRLRERLAARRVEVLAVNFQENAARIAPFVERLGVSFPVVRDHDGTRAYRVERHRVPDDVHRRPRPAHRMGGHGRGRLGRPARRITHSQSRVGPSATCAPRFRGAPHR